MKHARSNSTRKARNSLSRAVYWSVAAGCLSAAAPLMAAEPTIALIADRFQGNLPQGQHDWPDGVYTRKVTITAWEDDPPEDEESHKVRIEVVVD